MNRVCLELYQSIVIVLIATSTSLAQTNLQLRSELYIQELLSRDNSSAEGSIEYEILDHYYSASSGLTHFIYIQTLNGVPLENTLLQIHIMSDGRLFTHHHNFLFDASKRIVNHQDQPALTMDRAIQIALKDHPRLRNKPAYKIDKHLHTGSWAVQVSDPLSKQLLVEHLYRKNRDGSLQQAWKIRHPGPKGARLYETYIDVFSGEVIERQQALTRCNLTGDDHRHFPSNHSQHTYSQEEIADNSSYFVFPFPFESPLETAPRLVEDPASPEASPFGWHDTNGVDGPEYTITRGNNAHAYVDRNSDNSPDQNEPDGGATLTFNFPYALDSEPSDYEQAATTHLFYSLNWMHDFAFHYGFDEAVNFQATNYSGAGEPGDPVFGNVFYGEMEGDFNNAFFIPTPDGLSGAMHANLWSQTNDLLTINSPESIAGEYETGDANFGPSFAQFPIEGVVAVFQDESTRPTQACFPAKNGIDLMGKIALIDRGECNFDVKVDHAEKAGAIACIICNFEDVPVGMASGTPGLENPGISAISISSSDCALIKNAIQEGVQVRIGNKESTGPMLLYSGLDNGVVAHEYGHGISSRLVGGPSIISCLRNVNYNDDEISDDGEQMGEGWSDFFTLVTLVKSTDDRNKPRTVGNYILRQDENGRGVRNYPYAYDMTISPYTYEDVWTAPVPHGVGAVFAAFLWDIYWGFVDLYGFDEDPFKGTGGNNKAIQLVMDGMKLTPCSPGFIDGRNALLQADQVLFQGAHQCLIWEMAARRGLGFNADQGLSTINADGKVSFETLPACITSIKVIKTATDIVDPGGIIDYEITVYNHLDQTAQNVVVQDVLANGLAIVANSASAFYTREGNTLTFTIPSLSSGDSLSITYRAIVPAEAFSIQQIYEDMESGDAKWDFINREGSDIWELDNTLPRSGEFAWFVPNTVEENDQILEYNQPIPVQGDLPVLRFYHFINVQHGFDGGILELSNDGGNNWIPVPGEDFLRNGYPGPLRYDALSIPNLMGFYGTSNQYQPVYLDLSAYKGENIYLRFRFGSNNFIGQLGWIIDDFEIMDLKRYKTEVCVRADGISPVCTMTSNEGTFVESDLSTPVITQQLNTNIHIYPNPNREAFNLEIDDSVLPVRQLEIFNSQGVLIYAQALENLDRRWRISTRDWKAGFYWIVLHGESGIITEKLIKN